MTFTRRISSRATLLLAAGLLCGAALLGTASPAYAHDFGGGGDCSGWNLVLDGTYGAHTILIDGVAQSTVKTTYAVSDGSDDESRSFTVKWDKPSDDVTKKHKLSRDTDDCVPTAPTTTVAPTTTTTSTSTTAPPTTTTTVPATTTTVPRSSTSTTTIAPTTTTTIATVIVAPTSTTKPAVVPITAPELPRTGRSTVPMGTVGFMLLSAGVALVIAAARRRGPFAEVSDRLNRL